MVSSIDQDRLFISPDLGILRFLKIKSATFPASRVFITIHICCFDFRYNYLLLIMNYVFPLVTLSVTYTRVGIELWGSRAIGEDISMQHDRVKSKRKVRN